MYRYSLYIKCVHDLRGDCATAPLWANHEYFGELVSLFSELLPSQFIDVITFRRRKTDAA
jgi:hypothetical protein